MPWRPSCWATAMVVPEPMNGSRVYHCGGCGTRRRGIQLGRTAGAGHTARRYRLEVGGFGLYAPRFFPPCVEPGMAWAVPSCIVGGLMLWAIGGVAIAGGLPADGLAVVSCPPSAEGSPLPDSRKS